MTAKQLPDTHSLNLQCPNCSSKRIGQLKSHSSTIKRILLSTRPVDLNILDYAEGRRPQCVWNDDSDQTPAYNSCPRCKFIWSETESQSGIVMDKIIRATNKAHCPRLVCGTCGGIMGYPLRFKHLARKWPEKVARTISQYRSIEVCAMGTEVSAAFQGLPSRLQGDVLNTWAVKWEQDCDRWGANAARVYLVIYSSILPVPHTVQNDSRWISHSIDHLRSSKSTELTKSLFRHLGPRSTTYPEFMRIGRELLSQQLIEELCVANDQLLSENTRREAEWNHPDVQASIPK